MGANLGDTEEGIGGLSIPEALVFGMKGLLAEDGERRRFSEVFLILGAEEERGTGSEVSDEERAGGGIGRGLGERSIAPLLEEEEEEEEEVAVLDSNAAKVARKLIGSEPFV